MQAPARLIANNAGVEGDVIVEKVFGKSWETGYNAMDDRIEDLLEAGIIDPAKVGLITAHISFDEHLTCLFNSTANTPTAMQLHYMTTPE